MAPKRASTASTKASRKRQKTMTLEDKVKLLDKCRAGMSVTAVGRLYHMNESTVRYIKKKEENIRATVNGSALCSAKHVLQVRDKAVLRMENDLFIWMEDQHYKGAPVASNVIQTKAKSLYQHFKASEGEEPVTPFQAGKGWLRNFKRRFSLSNRKMTGEAASRDHDSAAAFQEELKAITGENGCKLEQVAEDFQDMGEGDAMELAEENNAEVTEENDTELVQSASEEEEDKDDSRSITLKKLAEMTRLLEALKSLAHNADPSAVRALKFMRGLDDSFLPYKKIMEEMKRKKKQLPITMFFRWARTPPSKATAPAQPSTPSPASVVVESSKDSPLTLTPAVARSEDNLHDPPLGDDAGGSKESVHL